MYWLGKENKIKYINEIKLLKSIQFFKDLPYYVFETMSSFIQYVDI